MTVPEYEREFVRLSKYARDCVSIEAIMCKKFEDELNEDIRLLVGILELKEFVVLVERACKAEKLAKEKRKVDLVSRDLKKRQLNKSFQSSSKKLREFPTRPKASTGDCLERTKRRNLQGTRSDSTANKGKPQRNLGSGTRNLGSGTSSKGAPSEFVVKPEGRAPTRTYAIRAREEASSLNVMTGTFSIYETPIVALIDPVSTHSYICVKLVSGMNLFIEPTKFILKVSNPLDKYVLVDQVCKNCHLMTRGHYFLANLMLLPFNEFDVILGMDWLTTHDVVVNCGRKFIQLKCENGNVLRVEPDELNGMPAVITSMSTQRCIRKGYEAYLTFVLNTKESELKIESVLVVCEYLDVFPEELSRLPLIREVECGIDLTPVTAPILIAPYRMAPI
ncbi:uncharacterized protein [Gossypium hirsutum]|uniref:Gag-Pol polyprotein n=1 Tax=Gossypium hirsutum TaxID=3635 RepID=A0ABM2ZDC0_GOSHI|nr:uncharacterized protein LOC121212297 [Gossypium hirsutum]